MARINSAARLFCLLWIAFLACGCTTLSKTDDPSVQQSADPLVGINRRIFAFNAVADKRVLRPTAKAYSTVVPKRARIGVSNFFANLGEPLNFVNNLLQGKGKAAVTSGYRFAINSTVGVLGLIDIAKLQNIERKREDLGQTFAAWGIKPGPYLVLPFVGPTNFRDGVGALASRSAYYPIGLISDDNGTRIGLTILNIVDTRSQFLNVDQGLSQQVDPYSFVKSVFETNRLNAIYDGDPPENNVDDIDDF